jgi:hypothetical protein
MRYPQRRDGAFLGCHTIASGAYLFPAFVLWIPTERAFSLSLRGALTVTRSC